MNLSTAQRERRLFAARLILTLARHGLKPSATSLVKILNARSKDDPITSHAFRKWLKAESMPTQRRVCVLAEWLEVTPEWLRFGDADTFERKGNAIAGEISRDIFLIAKDYRMLDDHSRIIFNNTLKHLLKVQAKVIPSKV